MKSFPLFILTFLMVVSAMAQPKVPSKENFKKSEAQWAKMAAKSKGNYAYSLLATAHGRKIETRVIVQNGVVTGALMTTRVPGKPTQRTAFEPNPSRHIYTLEKVYQDIEKRIWPKFKSQLKITYNKQGLLQEAGYERVGCKGDCYEGYRIADISLKLGVREQIILSMVKWTKQKAVWNNSYLFVVISGGKAAGFRSERTVYVRNGEIIKVADVRVNYKTNTSSRRLYTRAERKKTGTLDSFYAYAITKVAPLSPKDKDIFFRTDDNGLIALAGSAIKGCEDDCFTGYNISRIQALK